MFLSALLAEHFPETEVVATAATEDETVSTIARHQPDVVLMDIELQTGTGFGVLQRVPQTDAYIIFTTALDHEASIVLRLCGAPYISKPVDVESLAAALKPASLSSAREQNAVAMAHLRAALEHHCEPQAICTNAGEGFEYVPIADIVSICQRGAGCTLALKSGGTRATQHSLKELETLLKDFGFFRTHMHCIVARRHIVGRVSADGSTLQLSDGSTAPVSPKKLEAFRVFMEGG